jgi:hypothetical protein
LGVALWKGNKKSGLILKYFVLIIPDQNSWVKLGKGYTNLNKKQKRKEKKRKIPAWWRQSPRMCDWLEVGSYGCGTCSLAPVGFWEKNVFEFHYKIHTLKHLLYF